MVNGWKVVSIILILILILESGFIYWAYSVGIETIEQESVCAYTICGLDDSNYYDAYNYEPYSKMCYCYQEGEIEKQKYIG